MPEQEKILLLTKLHRPRLSKDLLARPRLIELLNHDIDLPLILVCAPAGFGKTTLVSTWIERMAADHKDASANLPAAWLSLDENDSDLGIFVRYVIAALCTIFKDACEGTLTLLRAQRTPPKAVLNSTFINELAELAGEAILVLDDYHLIHEAEVHKLLGELVSHWPGSLHLVLISRTSPPIQLSSLRGRGMLGEIRTRDLRFTPEETAAYLSQLRTAPVSQNALPLLEERFEGWPAGLHLASLSLRSKGSQESVLATLSSENPNITGYLVDEVLNHQFPAIHTFLLKTSILDRFCASLCEAVIGEIDPAWNVSACLDWIERSELFLIPLDDRREWFRFHHLFQEMLQQRLSAETAPDQVKGLHLRASAWLEEHGLIDEAIHHALKANDLDLAASYMADGLRDVLNREDRPTLERWQRLLPEEMINRQPWLLMIRAWDLQFMWRLDLQAQILHQVEILLDSEQGEKLPAEDLPILRGQILLIKAQYTYFSNQMTRTIDLCREVLAVMPPSWTFVRGSAMLYLGFSMQANGQIVEAERMLLNEYESGLEKTDLYPLILLQTLGFIYLLSGQLEKCIKTGHLLIQGAIRSGNTFTRNWGDYYVGMASYLCHDLDTANQYFTKILNDRYLAHYGAYRDAVVGLALIHQIKEERAEAWQMVEAISQFDLEQSGIEDERTRSLRARLMLLQGDLEGARRWVATFSGPPPDQAMIFLEEPQVTRVRVLLASETEPDRRLVLQILDILDEIFERTHNTRYKIEVLALRALALEAQGESDHSNAVLKQALELAQPGGFIRVFVDLGKPMLAMLQRPGEQGHFVELLKRILAAFQEDRNYLLNRASPVTPKPQPLLSNSALVEPLTARELEVLSLLREPLSMKEIALQLSISYATAKRHTINIYAKLGVSQRWKAVARAEEMNVFPPR